MATTYGYVGRILRVDLTTGKITETPTSDYVPKWIGGRGVAAMIYWEEVSPECKAFDPENALIMISGVADGTLLPSGSRLCIASKTPVLETECYMVSTPSGHLSAELKFAGYDGIVLKGKSPKPVYLWIHEGKAELRSAERLWGMRVSEVMLELYSQHGFKTRIAAIGPAGENLVRQAPIILEREHATGISGAGAVMGSKMLKAIVVRGTGEVNVAKPKEVLDLWYYYRRLLNRTPAEVAAGEGWPTQNKSLSYYMYHNPHTPYTPGHPASPKDPKVYFKNYGLDDPISLMREAVDKGTVKIKWGGCYTCSVSCALTYQSKDIDIPSGSGQCNDMESWPRHDWKGYKKVVGVPDIWFNRWCDDLGLSITNTAGYHFHWWDALVEAGIITKENAGLPVRDTWTLDFIKGILEKIAYRKGEIFDGIAEGEIRFLKKISQKYPEIWNRKPSRADAPILTVASTSLNEMYDQIIVPKSERENGYFLDKIGGPAQCNYAPTLAAIMNATAIRREVNGVSGSGGKSFSPEFVIPKGLTSAQVNAIQKKGNLKYFGFEDATDVSGAEPSWRNKVATAIWCQNFNVMMDCLPLCRWAGAYSLYSTYTPPDFLGDPTVGARYFSAITGIATTNEQLLGAMGPIWNLERCIHVREGRRRKHDGWNDTIYRYKEWAWTNKQEFEGKVLDEYYSRRGWDLATGIPKRSVLETQGLKRIADELEQKYGVKVPA